MREAGFYITENAEKKQLRCQLCRHYCLIDQNKKGVCGVRENRDGILYSLVYGKPAAMAVDPIEKKPLYHFLPGSLSFSLATVGCNFHCDCCQNYSLAHPATLSGLQLQAEVSAEQVVAKACENDCQSISYTYSEPTIFLEYAIDIAQAARDAGLKNNLVTNGYFSAQAIEQIIPLFDAANIDLKGFDKKRHLLLTGADIDGVLQSIQALHQAKVWIELTTLLIPGQNDAAEELAALARFIAQVSPDIPWHISRFHPDWKMRDRAPTTMEDLKRARQIGERAGLNFIYLGNVAAQEGAITCCPACKTELLRRGSFSLLENHLQQSACPSCEKEIPGRWN